MDSLQWRILLKWRIRGYLSGTLSAGKPRSSSEAFDSGSVVRIVSNCFPVCQRHCPGEVLLHDIALEKHGETWRNLEKHGETGDVAG